MIYSEKEPKNTERLWRCKILATSHRRPGSCRQTVWAESSPRSSSGPGSGWSRQWCAGADSHYPVTCPLGRTSADVHTPALLPEQRQCPERSWLKLWGWAGSLLTHLQIITSLWATLSSYRLVSVLQKLKYSQQNLTWKTIHRIQTLFWNCSIKEQKWLESDQKSNSGITAVYLEWHEVKVGKGGDGEVKER